MEMKSKIEVTVNNFLDHKLIQECSRMLRIYIINVYIYTLLLILLIPLLFMLFTNYVLNIILWYTITLYDML